MEKAKQPHDGTICGAKTREGTPCKQRAGWGTDHVGEGRCKLHGGKSTGAPKQNKNAEKHGLFTKYLPEETKELAESIIDINYLDLLWQQITLQYAAIIRSQKIMYVKDKEEMIKELKKKKGYDSETVSSTEIEYEFQFAWDRQATFLTAQSRAMAELRNMISKYDELLRSNLATEEQTLRIEKLKVDIDKVKDRDNDKPIEILIRRKGEDK